MKNVFFLMMLITGLSITAQAQRQVVLTGTCLFEQAGSCRMAADPIKVKIILSIDDNTAKITGQEYWMNEENKYEKKGTIAWSGEVLNSKSMRFKQERQVTCGNENRTEVLNFIGVNMGDNRMEFDDRYVMCPASNCIFEVGYDLEIE